MFFLKILTITFYINHTQLYNLFNNIYLYNKFNDINYHIKYKKLYATS